MLKFTATNGVQIHEHAEGVIDPIDPQEPGSRLTPRMQAGLREYFEQAATGYVVVNYETGYVRPFIYAERAEAAGIRDNLNDDAHITDRWSLVPVTDPIRPAQSYEHTGFEAGAL